MIDDGGRYSFRPVEAQDLDLLADHRNDPDVWENLTSILPVLKDQQHDWLASLGTDKYYFIGYFFDEIPIAFLRLTDIDWVNRNAAVGIDIFKDYRGRGHAKDMFELLVGYCFNVLNLHRVWLLVRERNTRAIRVYEEVGFLTEGTMREHLWRFGAYEDYRLMGLLREDWLA